MHVVVKPNCSAGSDGVSKCGSIEEAVTAFYLINGVMNGLGQVNNGALVQVLTTKCNSDNNCVCFRSF